MDEYKIVGKTVSIKFTSRASVKVNDSFYTVEACEERMIPDIEGVDIEKEKEALWDSVNSECDSQIQEILRTFRK
jgi:hypothetical protein